jgi:membrane protease YdiL (CAAX protease family)
MEHRCVAAGGRQGPFVTHSISSPGHPTAGASLGRILLGAALMFAVLQVGLTVLVPSLGMTWTPVLVTLAMFALLFVIERVAFGRNPLAALAAVGFGRPTRGSLVVAAIVGGGMLLFFPLYSAATGVSFALKADWLGLLVGSIALNGLAEETLFRGFVFGHLRQAGHSFRRAALISLLVFGAIHLVLFASNPLVIAFLATLLALAAAFPYAFLYERAGRTIWAGAIVHVAGHAVRFVDMPEAQVLVVSSIWTVALFGGVFLVLAFRNNLLRAPAAERPLPAAATAT